MDLLLKEIKIGNTLRLVYKNLIVLERIRNIDIFNFRNINNFIPESEIIGKVLFVDKHICIIKESEGEPPETEKLKGINSSLNNFKVIPISLITDIQNID